MWLPPFTLKRPQDPLGEGDREEEKAEGTVFLSLCIWNHSHIHACIVEIIIKYQVIAKYCAGYTRVGTNLVYFLYVWL